MNYRDESNLGKYEKKVVEYARALEEVFWKKLEQIEDGLPDIETAFNSLDDGCKHALVWLIMHYILGFEPKKRIEMLNQMMQHVQLNVWLNLEMPTDPES